jgi:predicted YcjX-like family ATPase
VFRLIDLAAPVRRLAEDAAALADNAVHGGVRIGVTGLSGAGKTVFVTALVHNLTRAGRMAGLAAVGEGRLEAALLQPQPDPDVPRFDYEGAIAALQADDPQWPASTRRTSQLRLSVRYRPGSFLRRQVRGSATLHLDFVDYPGEWLLDLSLLKLRYADWCRQVLDDCAREPRARLAADWLAHVGALDPGGPAEEAEVRRCAALYTEFLQAARAHGGLHRLQPGRFLLPGELEGSPALTFSPLTPPDEGRRRRGTLWELMESRFEAYKDRIVRPFFRDHFARVDRQIVLVDLLQALNVGAYSVEDLQMAMAELLESFRPGRNSWLWPILGRRVERVLFAATKADHVPASQHDRLAGLLGGLLFSAANRAAFQGARVETMAIAAVRATREAQARRDGAVLDCVEGRPVDGGEPVVAFPGELPATPEAIAAEGAGHYGFVPFRPPAAAGRDGRGLPHLRLDRALEFLIGDLLE